MSAGIFTTGPPSTTKQPQALNSILLGAYYSYDLSPPNLNKPELWVYGEAGGMFTGNEGNTFYLESGLDLHLKWRLSLRGWAHVRLPHDVFELRSGRLGVPAPGGAQLVKYMSKTGFHCLYGAVGFRAVVLATVVLAAGAGCASGGAVPADVRVPPELLRGSPYTASGESGRSRYVVRMTDGQRDWEIQLPEIATAYEVKVPLAGKPAAPHVDRHGDDDRRRSRDHGPRSMARRRARPRPTRPARTTRSTQAGGSAPTRRDDGNAKVARPSDKRAGGAPGDDQPVGEGELSADAGAGEGSLPHAPLRAGAGGAGRAREAVPRRRAHPVDEGLPLRAPRQQEPRAGGLAAGPAR